MMNNNFKIFFRKFIWAIAALYIGVLFPFVGLKTVKVAYREIKSNIDFNSSLAAVTFGADKSLASHENDINKENLPSVDEPSFDIADNTKNSKDNEISFTFVGDIMLDRNVENSIYKNGAADFSFVFENTDFLKESDIVFGNLEGPVSDKGEDLGNLYSFRMNPLVMPALEKAGFNVLSIANNHTADWGKEAFLDTLDRLKQAGIVPVGGGEDRDDAEKVKIIEKNGFKVGFLAFTDVGPKWFGVKSDNPGILLADVGLVKKLTARAKTDADYVVVSFHFGNEYQTTASSRQEELAKSAIDAGANIVVGHHPHVVQKIELYNGGIIAYSLGNFIFDQNFSEETMEGVLLNVVFSGQHLSSVYKKRVKLNEFFQVYLSDYDN